jgi:hypoxanthine phosphoribosyltransferase
MQKNQKILRWEDIIISVDKICGWIKPELSNISSIHGISKGGLIPAVMISHKLNIPYVSTPIKNTITIDDICNSGVTLRDYDSTWKGALYYKTLTSCFCPNVWGVEYNDDEILVFPWETDNLDYLKDESIQSFLNNPSNNGKELDHLRDGHYIAGMTNDKEGSFMKFQNKIKTKNK